MNRLLPADVVTTLPALLDLQGVAARLRLPSARRAVHSQQGRHRSRLRGRGLEFSEVRPYQPGDDIRTIDWRVTARRQTAHTKLFHEERERPVFIICDQRHPMFFASTGRYKSVLAAEVAALIAWLAWQSGDRLGGMLISDDTLHLQRPDHRRRSLMAWMESLHRANTRAGARATAPISMATALREATRIHRPGALVILVSDFADLDDGAASSLHRLRQHGDVVAIRVLDPLETRLPDAGQLLVSWQGRQMTVDTHDAAIRQRYEDTCTARDDRLRNLFNQFGIALVDGRTVDGADVLTGRLLRQLGRRT